MRLIDADALIEYCNNQKVKTVSANDIARFPTIDAAPVKHGRWDDSFDGITPYCSICHMTHKCFNRTPNYCPSCGAKMDLEEQDARTEQSGK